MNRWQALLASTALVSVAGTMAHAQPVGGNQPVGGGQGNGVQFTGPVTTGDCVKAAGGPFIQDAGAPCAGGGAGNPGGATNSIQFNSAGSFGGLGIVNSAVVVTDGSGNPSESTNLPTTVQANITQVGTVTTGTWHGTILTVPFGGSGGATFTSNAPLIGNGVGTFSTGSRSGNTTVFVTSTGSLVTNDCVKIDVSGNYVDAGAACSVLAAGSTNSIQINAGAGQFGAVGIVNSAVVITSSGGVPSESTNLPTTVQSNITQLGTITAGVWNGSTVGAGFGGTGLTTGSSGGVLVFTSSNTLSSSAALTTNNPVLGGGAGNVPTVGSRTGNTTLFATATGSFANGNCVQIDSNANLKDALIPCGGTGSSGTVTAGTAGQIAYYATNSTVIVGNANVTVATGSVTVGQAGTVTGSVTIQNGAASGQGVVIQALATTNTYNFNLPAVAGASGRPLVSGGGAGASMFYGTVSGNTSLFVTSTGSLVTNDCVKIDASGNYVDSGAACAGAAAIASNTVLGNVTSTNSVPTAITASQLTALVNVFSSTLSGAAPSASGNDPTKLLSAAGQWVNTLTQTNTSSNMVFTLDDSAVSGGFRAAVSVQNSARQFIFGSYGAADGVSASGAFAVQDGTANRLRFSLGPTGGASLADTSGGLAADLGAGNFSVPSAGGYFLNASKNYGLSYPGVAPTAGAGNNSIVGVIESGTNIAGSNPPALILDQSINNGNVQSGRHFATLDSNWQNEADTISLISHNAQMSPTATYSSVGIGGTWLNGDVAKITVTSAAISGGSVVLQCTVGSTCNGAWGGGTGTNIIAGYMNNQFNVNTLLTSAAIYADPNDVIANYPSAGFNGFGFLVDYQSTLVALSNGSTTASGTMSLQNATAGAGLLDGPVGLLIYRQREIGSNRVPVAGDNIGVIQFLGPTTAAPAGGIPMVEIQANNANPDTPLGVLNIYTQCSGGGGAANGNGCQRLIVRAGVSVPDSGGTFHDNGQGTVTVESSGGFYVGATAGATCGPGSTTASFQVINGIVTHC